MDQFWEEYYSLKKRLRNGENVEQKFINLAGIVAETAENVVAGNADKKIESLANLFYHCQELLSMNYGTSSQKVFPIYSIAHQKQKELFKQKSMETIKLLKEKFLEEYPKYPISYTLPYSVFLESAPPGPNRYQTYKHPRTTPIRVTRQVEIYKQPSKVRVSVHSGRKPELTDADIETVFEKVWKKNW